MRYKQKEHAKKQELTKMWSDISNNFIRGTRTSIRGLSLELIDEKNSEISHALYIAHVNIYTAKGHKPMTEEKIDEIIKKGK